MWGAFWAVLSGCLLFAIRLYMCLVWCINRVNVSLCIQSVQYTAQVFWGIMSIMYLNPFVCTRLKIKWPTFQSLQTTICMDINQPNSDHFTFSCSLYLVIFGDLEDLFFSENSKRTFLQYCYRVDCFHKNKKIFSKRIIVRKVINRLNEQSFFILG